MIAFVLCHIFTLLTIPGCIVHEISHKFFCDLFDVPVKQVNYFIPFSERAGSVCSQLPTTFAANYLIAIAPLIINTVLCMLFTLPYSVMFYYGTQFISSTLSFDICNGLLYWAGISIGICALPSKGDLSNLLLYNDTITQKIIILITKAVLFPFNSDGLAGLFFKTLYAVGTSFILPILFFK